MLACMVLPVAAQTQIDNSKSLFNADGDLGYDGGAENVNIIGTDKQQQDSFVNVVKAAVNRVLGILALIALLILLYGGFLMVTSAGDEEKYKKGFTILKHAAIGLLLIGVAWFIISLIFWLVNKTTDNPGTAGTES
ncbi:MAG: hypothetical protein Q8O99_01345 [bacterium]|nr:hypothetical protein [bacterium]